MLRAVEGADVLLERTRLGNRDLDLQGNEVREAIYF